jgi:hypothetical protein
MRPGRRCRQPRRLPHVDADCTRIEASWVGPRRDGRTCKMGRPPQWLGHVVEDRNYLPFRPCCLAMSPSNCCLNEAEVVLFILIFQSFQREKNNNQQKKIWCNQMKMITVFCLRNVVNIFEPNPVIYSLKEIQYDLRISEGLFFLLFMSLQYLTESFR